MYIIYTDYTNKVRLDVIGKQETKEETKSNLRNQYLSDDEKSIDKK
jgi:hypothetical protein